MSVRQCCIAPQVEQSALLTWNTSKVGLLPFSSVDAHFLFCFPPPPAPYLRRCSFSSGAASLKSGIPKGVAMRAAPNETQRLIFIHNSHDVYHCSSAAQCSKSEL
ncbi:hypothetical protein CDAR_294681 [Caerostris darwini]|uniref:Uncharacterized protein n=1 Tax=Caerostris darwini TaxID=1538125 RepID=A0AAV4UK44_9ARAC|nr:hypothetical protein CDAR_294681 [Caerostris darwini]